MNRINYILMNLEELQKLFPKWNIYEDDDYIVITGKYIRKRYYIPEEINIDINKMINIYNSIDYIIEFLLHNNFKQYFDSWDKEYYYLKSIVSVEIYPHYYEIISKASIVKCASDDCIRKIKELLDIEIPFKKVLND